MRGSVILLISLLNSMILFGQTCPGINDETLSATNESICVDGSTGTTITTGSSVAGVEYYLKNSETDAVVDTQTGTGSGLTFDTGNLSENTTFYVSAVDATPKHAVEIDGVNDYIDAGTHHRNITTTVTMALWVKTTITGQYKVIASKYDGSQGYQIYINESGKVFFWGKDGTTDGPFNSGLSSTAINDGNWHYVVGVANATINTFAIYIDGELESSSNATITQAGTFFNQAPLLVGYYSSTGYFNGQVDQLTLWNTELSYATIYDNSNSCLTGSEDNIVAHFKFDEGSGATNSSDRSFFTSSAFLQNMDVNAAWVSGTSPSCPTSCEFRLIQEVSIGDFITPTALAQNIAVQLDATGSATIAAADVDNGSTDNCSSGNLVFSLSQYNFTCSNIGDNTVTLTVTDEAGNESTATATVTVNSLLTEETITVDNLSACADGTIVTLGGSISGVNYYLRNDADESVIAGPVAGTGGSIDLNTGTLNEVRSYHVYSETQSSEIASNALDFDGVDDRVSTAFLLSSTTELTIEAWIFPRKTTYSRFISNFQGSGSINEGVFILDSGSPSSNNGRALRFIVGGAEDVFNFHLDNMLTLNQWNHVAVTFNNGEVIFYVNGNLEGSPTASFTTIPDATTPMYFGEDTNVGTAAEFFDGKMDEVRIWNVARTASEIANNKNKNLSEAEPNLLAYYTFNETEGLSLSERVNSNDGTLLNMDGSTDWVEGVALSSLCALEMSTVVTIGETISPTVVTKNITVSLDADGNAEISPQDVNDGSTDNCTELNSLVLTLNNRFFSCSHLGTNNVTLYVTDEFRNQGSAIATVEVVDEVAPQVIVHDITINLDANGEAIITYTDIDNGSNDNCTAANNLTYSLDVADFDTSNLGINVVTLTVTDASGNSASNAANVEVIEQQSQTITFNALAEKTYGDADFNVEATASSGLAVMFESSNTNVININGNTITIVGAGSATITASQAGNVNFSAAAPVQQTLTVNKAGQTITLAAISDKNIDDLDFDVTVSASSGLTVSLSVTGEATISGTTITLAGTSGTVSVTASQAGDDNYLAADDETVVFNVIDPSDPCANFSIEVASITDVASGNDGAADITVSGGFAPYTFNWTGGATSEDISGVVAGNYTVTVTDANGCQISTTITIGDIITGIWDQINGDFKWYPNPVKNKLNIEASFEKATDLDVQIMDLSGRVLISKQWNNRIAINQQLDVSALSKGQYLLVVITDIQRHVEMISVTR